MKDLFDFNHIDPSINEETKKELKEMYKSKRSGQQQ